MVPVTGTNPSRLTRTSNRRTNMNRSCSQELPARGVLVNNADGQATSDLPIPAYDQPKDKQKIRCLSYACASKGQFYSLYFFLAGIGLCIFLIIRDAAAGYISMTFALAALCLWFFVLRGALKYKKQKQEQDNDMYHHWSRPCAEAIAYVSFGFSVFSFCMVGFTGDLLWLIPGILCFVLAMVLSVIIYRRSGVRGLCKRS